MKHTTRLVPPTAADINVLVSRTLADFREWWPRGTESSEARCFAFQRADILEVWCDTIGRARRIEPLFAGVFTPDGRPALLLPLGLKRQHGIRMLRFLDAGVSDYNAPVAFPAAAELGGSAQLWAALRVALPPFDLALLEKMPAAIEDLPNPLFELAGSEHHEDCHAVRLFAPWEKIAAERIEHLSDSRRRRRKLEKLGPVRLCIAETPEEQSRFLEAMIAFKRRKFRETKGFDAFDFPGIEEFYRESTRRLADHGPVQLSALLLGDEILAAHWGYVAGRRFYHLMPGYQSGSWRAYAPGRLLNEWLLQWCVEHHFEFFDFGIGDEPYKFDYCDTHIKLRDAYLPQTSKGRLLATALRLKTESKASLRETRLGATLMAARRYWRNARRSRSEA